MLLRTTWVADAGENGGLNGNDLDNEEWDDVEPTEQPLIVIRQDQRSMEHGKAKPLQKVKSDPDQDLNGEELPDVRMQLAEQAPTSSAAASALREAVPEPSSTQPEPVVSPFKEKAAQQRDSESGPKVAAAAKKVKKKLVLPTAPTAREQKRGKQKRGSPEAPAVPAEAAAATVASGSSSAKQDPGRGQQFAADRLKQPTDAAAAATASAAAASAAAAEIWGADAFTLGQPGNDSAAEAEILRGPPAPDAALPALNALPEPTQSQPSGAALAALSSPSREWDSKTMPGSGGGHQQPGNAQATEPQPEDRGVSMPQISQPDAPPSDVYAGSGPNAGERAEAGQPGNSELPASGVFARSSRSAENDAQQVAGQGNGNANRGVLEIGTIKQRDALEPIPDSSVLNPDPGKQHSLHSFLTGLVDVR